MKKVYYSDIANAVKCLHYRHGVGDVKDVQLFADGRVEITAQPISMSPIIRRGRITSNANGSHTIRMYHHQLTVTIVSGCNHD